MTYKKRPLRELTSNIPAPVNAEPGFSEMEACLKMGIMPHEWFTVPRWSRVLTVAVSNIRAKLDYLSIQDRK